MDAHEKKYLIFAYTDRCAIFQIIIGVFIPLLMIFYLAAESDLNVYIILLLFIVINVFVWIFVRKYLLQPIEVFISENGISLNYLSLDQANVKKTLNIEFENVTRFSDWTLGEEDVKFQLFFSQGQTFTLYKSGICYRKDDFELFIHDFKIKMKKYNTNQALSAHANRKSGIKYGDRTYLTAAFVLWGFACLMGFFLIYSLIEKEFNSLAALKGFLMFSALGFSNYIIHLRKKRKKE